MSRRIVLLRGVNVGSHNRIAMPALRAALEAAGFDDVRTYVQSGNVVLSSTLTPEKLATKVKQLVESAFGVDIEVIVRTRSELAAVVKRNPLANVATDPKRYLVTFLAAKPKRKLVDELAALASGGERLVAHSRELYAWHPAGIARSKLWGRMAGKSLGMPGTARNWSTVTKLLELAGD